MAFNCMAPSLNHWNAEHRLLIAGQALMLGKVLSRLVRQFLSEEELLFPAPSMSLSDREKEILTLAASGKTSKEIAEALGIAKITVDMHVSTILNKMGALNRYQAIAKAISNNLINVTDDGNAEYKSAKINAIRRAPRMKSVG
jgi:DNA-binding NarL/FixJ family response regulator